MIKIAVIITVLCLLRGPSAVAAHDLAFDVFQGLNCNGKMESGYEASNIAAGQFVMFGNGAGVMEDYTGKSFRITGMSVRPLCFPWIRSSAQLLFVVRTR